MSSDWFKNWFNTEEYLNVYRHRNEDDAEEHIKLILNNVTTKSGANVLDMACGAGRHAILLARKNYHVTAVDLSENLLSIAQQTAGKEKLLINFVHSDIRKFNSTIKYDLILNLFTSFGYFETDEENFLVLKKANNLLTDNGYFVLDFFNSIFLEKNLVEYSKDIANDVEIHQYRALKDKRVNKKIVVNKNGKLSQFEESVRMFTNEELIDAITKIGFDIYKTFGDFLGNEFDKLNSPRLIMICKK